LVISVLPTNTALNNADFLVASSISSEAPAAINNLAISILLKVAARINAVHSYQSQVFLSKEAPTSISILATSALPERVAQYKAGPFSQSFFSISIPAAISEAANSD
jgi:hypothetical protein